MRALVIVALLGTSASAEPQHVRGETIIIRDHAPGYKLPKPVKDPRIAPKYSDAAIEQDAWTRAWMVLDIDDRGVVQRMKWLKRPGYDLEQIAVERVFKTRFEPARDGLGRAQSAMLVYPIEWPSYWWLVTHTGFATRIPVSAGGVPCRGDGPLNLDRAHPVYRDCSLPDLTQMRVEPWIDRPRQ
jgi:hypothetical protein